MECRICFEIIERIVEYQITDTWKPLSWCPDCLMNQLQSKWSNYISNLKNPGCLPTLHRLLFDPGPPLYFSDCQIDLGAPIKAMRFQDTVQSIPTQVIGIDMHQALIDRLKNIDVYKDLHLQVLTILDTLQL